MKIGICDKVLSHNISPTSHPLEEFVLHWLLFNFCKLHKNFSNMLAGHSRKWLHIVSRRRVHPLSTQKVDEGRGQKKESLSSAKSKKSDIPAVLEAWTVRDCEWIFSRVPGVVSPQAKVRRAQEANKQKGGGLVPKKKRRRKQMNYTHLFEL